MKQFLRWLPALGWMAVIFAFSSQAHSGQITEAYLHGANILVRKMAHMAEYAVLAILYRRAMGGHTTLALLLTFLYAATDEWHQSFVPGRSASPIDVLVDTAGGWLGLSGLLLVLAQAKAQAKQNQK
jgi:VanZ family protein